MSLEQAPVRCFFRPFRRVGRCATATVERVKPLHAVPADPFTAAFGESRAVGWASTFNFRGARYSVPHGWVDQRVWVRVEGDTVVIVAQDPSGPVEIARHPLLSAGQASINEAHYPTRRDPLLREPKPRTRAEAAFLGLGAGAAAWLVEAAGHGARHIEARMAEAVELAKVFDPARVDRALGIAAVAARFSPGDLLSILSTASPVEIIRPSETHSLQPGTHAWSRITGPTHPTNPAPPASQGDQP